MNIGGSLQGLSPSLPNTTPLASPSAVDSKRAQLQTLLLKKSLEAVSPQISQQANQLQGKGQFLDIKV